MTNRTKRILFVSILAVVTVAILMGGVAYLDCFCSLVCSGPVNSDTAGGLFFGAVIWAYFLYGVVDLWFMLFPPKRKKKSPAQEVTKDA